VTDSSERRFPAHVPGSPKLKSNCHEREIDCRRASRPITNLHFVEDSAVGPQAKSDSAFDLTRLECGCPTPIPTVNHQRVVVESRSFYEKPQFQSRPRLIHSSLSRRHPTLSLNSASRARNRPTIRQCLASRQLQAGSGEFTRPRLLDFDQECQVGLGVAEILRYTQSVHGAKATGYDPHPEALDDLRVDGFANKILTAFVGSYKAPAASITMWRPGRDVLAGLPCEKLSPRGGLRGESWLA